MTEEEKKAIETLQYLCSDDCINKDIIKIIVNLIEKLQKENEELKEIYGILEEELKSKTEALDRAMSNPDYIPKDKVNEIIKYFEQGMQKECNGYIEVKYPFEVSYSGKVAKILRKKLLEEE